MLWDIMECDYDPLYTRTLKHTSRSKDVLAKTLVRFLSIPPSTEDADDDKSIRFHGEIRPDTSIAPNLKNVTIKNKIAHIYGSGWRYALEKFREGNIKNLEDEKVFEYISVLIRFRNDLDKIKYEDAIDIFMILYAFRYKFMSGICKLFKFQFEHVSSSDSVKQSKIHPFTMTQVQLYPELLLRQDDALSS